MDMGSVINRASTLQMRVFHVAVPELQQRVAAALMHLGRHRDAREILLRDPLVMEDGSIKANLDVNDLSGYQPPFISYGQVKDLSDQDGILFADSSESFKRMKDDEIADLSWWWMEGLEASWYEYLDLNPGARPDWMDEVGGVVMDIGSKTMNFGLGGEASTALATALARSALPLWTIQEYIENHTPFFTTYVGDEWADMVIASPEFFDNWAERVLG